MNVKLLKVFTLDELKLIARVVSVDLGVVVLYSEVKRVFTDNGILNFYLSGDRRTVMSKEQFQAIAQHV